MRLKHLTIIVAVLALAGFAQKHIQPPPYFTLTVAHINDTHSSFNPVNSSFKFNGTKVYTEFGGFPRLHTIANKYKAEAVKKNSSFLFLHAGDAWQGSIYFKLYEGAMNSELLNIMQLDAMALGNHEFDLSNAKLNRFISAINFPVLAANIDTEKDKDLKNQTNLKPFTVFAFDGNNKTVVKDINHIPKDKNLVAVLGLTLDDMDNIAFDTGDVKFLDLAHSAQQTVNLLHAKGIKNIIALTHIGNAMDIKLASRVNGIGLIVGGHSHTLLGDFTNIGLAKNGAYARRIKNPDNTGETCIVQSGESAQAMGLVNVTFDDNGRVVDCNGTNQLLSAERFYRSSQHTPDNQFGPRETAEISRFIRAQHNIAITREDPAMRQLIDIKYRPGVIQAYGKVIARVPQDLGHQRQPLPKATDTVYSEVAAIVAAGQYYWANTEEVRRVTGMKVDFSLVGAGAIRSGIKAGEYREGHVTLEMLPFSNFMSVLPVRGADVRKLIEEAVMATLPEGAHSGKFPYGGHLRFQYTETVAHQKGRLDTIEVLNDTGLTPTWQPLEDDRVYNIAINNYNASGNDGWTPLFHAQKTESRRIDLVYVNGTLTGFKVKNIEEVDGHYKVNYENAAPDCRNSRFRCNTDAQAVVDYISRQLPVVRPLAQNIVVFKRAS